MRSRSAYVCVVEITKADKQTPTLRQYEADVGRFIAAAGVLLYHYAAFVRAEVPEVELPFFSEVARYGYLGVPWFFGLSGYVISMSTDRATDAKEFAERRFIRIWPTLALAAVITTSFLLVTGGDPSFKALLQNLSLINTFDYYSSMLNVDGAYWSLWLEFRFYLIAAAVVALRGRVRLEHVANGLIAMTLIWVWLATEGLTGWGFDLVRFLSLNSWASMFGSGIIFAVARKEGWTPLRITLAIIGAAAVIPTSWVAGAELSDKTEIGEPSRVVIAALIACFVAFFFWIAPKTTTIPERWQPTAAYLGGLSYPLYLIHGEIGYQIFRSFEWNYWIEVSIAVIVAFSLGHMILRADQRISAARKVRTGLFAPARGTQ